MEVSSIACSPPREWISVIRGDRLTRVPDVRGCTRERGTICPSTRGEIMNSLDSTIGNMYRYPVAQRNCLLDSVFYNVGSLTGREQAALSPLSDREGTVIVVSPASSKREIRHYKNSLRFMNNEGPDIRAIALAGVGSSVLGTAALARDVADHYGFDVAGIVTGYGLTDLMTEAMGGWYFYGFADLFRHNTRLKIDNLMTTLRETPSLRSEASEKMFGLDVPDSRLTVSGSSDAGTFLDILIANPKKLSLIVAHSKGCLMTSFVLWHLVDELGPEQHPYYENLTIVTLGAVVTIPEEFRRTYQYIGELDWFGGMNSRLDLPHSVVPKAWHHLNPQFPGNLHTSQVLDGVPLE